MKRSAYLETTVIGYLAMRSSRDVRVAANQLSTREWWDDHRPSFDIFVSQFVLDECDQGDPTAADERRLIANPENRPKIERARRDQGMEPPLICTPFALAEFGCYPCNPMRWSFCKFRDNY